MGRGRHTDFTGEVAMNCVWKLNGFAAAGAGAPEPTLLPSLAVMSSAMVKVKVGVPGRRKVELGERRDEDVGTAGVAPASRCGAVAARRSAFVLSPESWPKSPAGSTSEGGLGLRRDAMLRTPRPEAMDLRG